MIFREWFNWIYHLNRNDFNRQSVWLSFPPPLTPYCSFLKNKFFIHWLILQFSTAVKYRKYIRTIVERKILQIILLQSNILKFCFTGEYYQKIIETNIPKQLHWNITKIFLNYSTGILLKLHRNIAEIFESNIPKVFQKIYYKIILHEYFWINAKGISPISYRIYKKLFRRIFGIFQHYCNEKMLTVEYLNIPGISSRGNKIHFHWNSVGKLLSEF